MYLLGPTDNQIDHAVRMLLVSGTGRGEACAEQASSSFVNGLCCDWCQLMFYDAAITATQHTAISDQVTTCGARQRDHTWPHPGHRISSAAPCPAAYTPAWKPGDVGLIGCSHPSSYPSIHTVAEDGSGQAQFSAWPVPV